MKRNKQVLKAAAWAMSFAMMVTCVDVPGAALAAKKPKLNKSKAVIRVGKDKAACEKCRRKESKMDQHQKENCLCHQKGSCQGQEGRKDCDQGKGREEDSEVPRNSQEE